MTTKTKRKPSCPRCGSAMRQRRSDRGPFWGCSNFPKCRGIVDMVSGEAGGQADAKRRRPMLPWGEHQEAVFTPIVKSMTNGNRTNYFIEAVAGSGKTTTIIELMWRVREALPKCRVLFLAFNRSIANELRERVPQGVNATTLHSFGLSALQTTGEKCKIEGDKLYWCISGSGTRGKQKPKPRPTGYTANPGRAEYLIVAKRVKQ